VGNINCNIAVSDVMFDPSVVPLPYDCQNEFPNKKETHIGSALQIDGGSSGVLRFFWDDIFSTGSL
jgi:hypothetical protein